MPGSINIGLGGQFASWAGSVLGLDCDLIVVAEGVKSAEEARSRLARVGIERVRGLVPEGVSGWVKHGFSLETVDRWTVEDLHAEINDSCPPSVVDVRREREWKDGHIPELCTTLWTHYGLSLRAFDRHVTKAVHCKSGYRSVITCSLLKSSAFDNVVNVLGGYDAWAAVGFPTVNDTMPRTAALV